MKNQILVAPAGNVAVNAHILRDLTRLYVKDSYVRQAPCPVELRALGDDYWIVKVNVGTS